MPTTSYLLVNDFNEDIDVFIEPHGFPIRIPAHREASVDVGWSQPGELEVVSSDGILTVYLWSTTTLALAVDGRCVYSSDYPVPGTPAGTSVREFLGLVLGTTPPCTDKSDSPRRIQASTFLKVPRLWNRQSDPDVA